MAEPGALKVSMSSGDFHGAMRQDPIDKQNIVLYWMQDRFANISFDCHACFYRTFFVAPLEVSSMYIDGCLAFVGVLSIIGVLGPGSLTFSE